jgi:DNA-binding transcriptional MerR regulator
MRLDLHPRAGFTLLRVDDLIPIGEFSARSGLSPKRLRSYAAGGLLVPAAVDSGSGYRFYAPGQLRVAELIDALRGAGMPLADIRPLLRRPSLSDLGAWAKRLESDVAQRHSAAAKRGPTTRTGCSRFRSASDLPDFSAHAALRVLVDAERHGVDRLARTVRRAAASRAGPRLDERNGSWGPESTTRPVRTRVRRTR